MSDQPKQKLRYWNLFATPDGSWRAHPVTGILGPPPGEDLAALRTGLSVPPGASVKVWRFCVTPADDRLARRGVVTREQKAEHAALALYGLHQQSQRTSSMHKRGVSVGAALRTLRGTGAYSEEALDRRVNAAATATSTPALLSRLRSLVTQLRGQGIPLDYDLLLRDLVAYDRAEGRPAVRERWGAAYYGWRAATDTKA
jgi:CRISPR system Cascade subunit CasB